MTVPAVEECSREIAVRRVYPLDQCALYKVRSRKRLCELLQVTKTGLDGILSNPTPYHFFTKEKSNGKRRQIAAPNPALKRVQRRIAELLARVEVPEHVSAPVRGRSHIDNAARHRGQRAFHLLDVRDFFPSCTAPKIAWFFGKQLGCSPDVTAILTKLTTLQGALPQGSPASPYLAYFAYHDMWDEIAKSCHHYRVKLTIYADDITLSGNVVPKALVFFIKERLKHHGHDFHEGKEVSQVEASVLITGVVVQGTRLLLPNRHHQKMFGLEREINRTHSKKLKEPMARSLVGMQQNAHQIEKADRLGSLPREDQNLC